MELVSFSLALALVVNPDGPLSVILSLVPVTAPIVRFMRVFIGHPGAMQVAVVVAGVAFRLGILLTGNKATVGQIVRLLRA